MSLVADILATYRTPREVMRRRLGATSEATALVTIVAACVLIFVAQWPYLARLAHLDPSVPFQPRVGGALLAWVFFGPPLFYALAGLIWIGFRIVGRAASGLTIRAAFFWGILAMTPMSLAYGLARGFADTGPLVTVTTILLAGTFLLFGASAISVAARPGADA